MDGESGEAQDGLTQDIAFSRGFAPGGRGISVNSWISLAACISGQELRRGPRTANPCAASLLDSIEVHPRQSRASLRDPAAEID